MARDLTGGEWAVLPDRLLKWKEVLIASRWKWREGDAASVFLAGDPGNSAA